MISQALCNSFKQEILQGIHQASDVYKIALFTSSASLSKATTVYSATNEVSGPGYSAGGIALVGFTTALDWDTAYIDWSTDPSWPTSSLTARGALIYNSTRANRAVAVLDFGADITDVNGTFLVTFPLPAAATVLIRWT